MRFTEKNDFFGYGLPTKNILGENQAFEIMLTDNNYIATNNIIVGNAISQIGQIEDVLEKWHIEDLDKFIEEQIANKRELNNILWGMEKELAELKKQLADKEMLLKYGMAEIKKLQKRINDIVKRDEKLIKSQPSEIVEKIKGIAIMELEEYSNDPILYKITEEELDDILKEYQK